VHIQDQLLDEKGGDKETLQPLTQGTPPEIQTTSVLWGNLAKLLPDPAADNYETVPDSNSTGLPELRIRVQVRLIRSWLPARWMAT
jgi:hypothetical protein